MVIEIIFNIITIVITSIAVIIAYVQIKKSISIAFADHARRKKQSTIEFFYKLNELTKQTLLLMKQFDESGSLNITLMHSDKDSDRELTEDVYDYLSNMECFAVGVNTGVYDLNTYNEITGRVAIERYDKLSAWIKELRKVNNSEKMFGEYESLINKIRELRRKPTALAEPLPVPK
jgi:hypothetical protein